MIELEMFIIFKIINKITFNKRKYGLLKKAEELAILCNIRLELTFTDLSSTKKYVKIKKKAIL
jgi:hypothetical protein